MTDMHSPASEAEVAGIITTARAAKTPLAILGGNTRAGLGHPVQAAADLSLARLTGITLYEPSEMVISARAGTPLKEITGALAAKGQMLPFEPMDHRRLYGTTGEPTIGGVVAANVSGPRRIAVGAARDHLIGVRFVTGRGEAVKSGGRVMKNVTGLDLVKLLAGSYGTLGVLTEVTFKVLPVPERSATLVVAGLSDHDAIAGLSAALGSPFEVNGAAHLPAAVTGGAAQTLIRVEGFVPSVEYRLERLRALLAAGSAQVLEGAESAALWMRVGDAAPLAEPRERAIWRLSLAPTQAAVIVAQLSARLDARHFYDWGGGLVWLSVAGAGDAGAALIRAALATTGGHATLVRAAPDLRASIPVFQPLSAPLMKLTAGIKHSLDPDGLLNPGRMYGGI